MSTKEKRMVKVPVTLDVDVARWCEARGTTPPTMTTDVRRYIHEAVEEVLLRRGVAAVMREEPGDAPSNVMDLTVDERIQEMWNVMRTLYPALDRWEGESGREQAYRVRGMIHAYAVLMGLSTTDVYAALDTNHPEPLVGPAQWARPSWATP